MEDMDNLKCWGDAKRGILNNPKADSNSLYRRQGRSGTKIRFGFLSLLFSLFISLPSFSQVIISGELRPKFEYRDGNKTLLFKDQAPAFLITQRSRLNLSYQDKKIKTLFSIQDVRLWGQIPYKLSTPGVHLYAAWGEYQFNDQLSVRLGRQELNYDRNRLLGVRNWNDVGATHDVALFKYEHDYKVHLGLAYNNDRAKNFENYYPLNYYKTMGFVRAEKSFGGNFTPSLVFIADGHQVENSDTQINYRLTYGSDLLFNDKSGKTNIIGTGYLQGGETKDGVPINAYFFSLSINNKIAKNISTTFAVDYFSGNDAANDNGKHNSFAKLYGNGHNYYGYMDYFTEVEKQTKGGGLMDGYFMLNYKVNKKVNTEFTYHYFSFTNNAMDSISSPGETVIADKYLGSELDLMLKYKPTNNFDIRMGYSVMFASQSMEIIKGGDHGIYQDWAWVLLTFKPEFFKYKPQDN